MSTELRVLILAAGKGTRMRSRRAKVLHEVCGWPILEYVLQAVAPLNPEETIVVIGHQGEQVRERFAGRGLTFVEQQEQLGTGHALLQARPALEGKGGELLIIPGDLPLLRAEPLKRFIAFHDGALSLLTMELEDPSGYGRIVRDRQGDVARIVEERDATQEQERIREVNSGIYLVHNDHLLWETLSELDDANAQGEYYLTDVVSRYRERGEAVRALVAVEGEELLGVNSRMDLARAEVVLRRRKLSRIMAVGATVIVPETVIVEQDVQVGEEAIIGLGSAIRGRSRIGGGALIESSLVEDFAIGERSRIIMSLISCKRQKEGQ